MEALTISATIQVAQLEELTVDDQRLVERAVSQTEHSYAPYSDFHVGAAVRLASGETFGGCNQENAAYGVAMCAERAALFAAGAERPEVAVEAIAIAARNAEGELTEEPVSPCGVCRQAMVETETRYHRRLRILLHGRRRTLVIDGVGTLMPLAFREF